MPLSRDRICYLGDSVYVEVERGMVKLTTENGWPGDPSNTIFLEEPVMRALIEWWTVVTQKEPNHAVSEEG